MTTIEEVNERTCKLMRKVATAYRTLEDAEEMADEWGWENWTLTQLGDAKEQIAEYMVKIMLISDEEVEK